jgi:hypothetical protein
MQNNNVEEKILAKIEAWKEILDYTKKRLDVLMNAIQTQEDVDKAVAVSSLRWRMSKYGEFVPIEEFPENLLKKLQEGSCVIGGYEYKLSKNGKYVNRYKRW